MQKSFKQYREDRELLEFGQKYENLCAAILESGIPFEVFWENHGLPFLLNQSSTNEMELLEGMNPSSWDWQGLWNGMKNSPTGQAIGAAGNTLAGAAKGAVQGAMNGASQSQLGQNVQQFFNPGQATTPQTPNQTPQPLSNDAQQKIGVAMDTIKNSFKSSMQGVINQFQQKRDSVGYQIAKGFLDRVAAYADKIKFKRGEGKFDQNTAFGPAQPTV